MNKPTDLKLSPHDQRARAKTAVVSSSANAVPPDAPRKPWKRSGAAELLDSSLQPFALAWIKSLPAIVKPLKCARHYPRVLNKIAALWGLDERCMECLNELLIDERGTRQGFNFGVHTELRRLKAYRISLLPREARHSDFTPTEPMPLDWPISRL